jgi:hypothetical protein
MEVIFSTVLENIAEVMAEAICEGGVGGIGTVRMMNASTTYLSGLVCCTTFPMMSSKMEIGSRRTNLSAMLSIC